MKIRSKIAALTLVAAISCLLCMDASAGDPFRKLGRGIINAGFGCLEVPMKIYDVNADEGGLAALSYGVFKGLGYFVAREVIGLVEIVTFPIPLPGAVEEPRETGWGYGCLMEPEWVVAPDHDVYNIIYQDMPLN